MTPSARAQAAIEIVDRLRRSARPLDHILRDYFRRRRFAGAKDRRRVIEIVYFALRNWMQLQYMEATVPRRIVAGALWLEGAPGGEVTELFNGSGYGPAPLQPADQRWLDALERDGAELPIWAALNVPAWLEPNLRQRFGANLAAEMLALDRPAPLDLRVNNLKTNKKKLIEHLKIKGILASEITLAPDGLRVPEHRLVTGLPEYTRGQFEVQDAGSQLAAALVDAAPGQQVVDYCAGAGGKSLAMASAMENQGQVFAFDVNAKRLTELRRRLRRNDVRNVQVHLLQGKGPNSVETALSGKADRVLVDVPCSATGTWRRHPEARVRLTEDQLQSYIAAQKDILARAALLVRPGGRLIYVTCSVLAEENERQIEQFLAENDKFSVLPAADVAAQVLGLDEAPFGEFANLTPAGHETDGFFIAILDHAREHALSAVSRMRQ